MAISTDIERLNYYEGEYLGAVDFTAEQEYHRDMRRRHNVGQHTWGIVSGLDLLLVPNGQTTGGVAEVDVYVQPGMATDGFGREMVMLNQTQLTADLFAAFYNPNPKATAQLMVVWITYAQSLTQPSEDACNNSNSNSNNGNNSGRIQESFQLVVSMVGAPPTDDSLTIDGDTVDTSTVTAGKPPTSAPDGSVLPPDVSIPFQQFPISDANLFWYVCLGQVMWNPYSGVFTNTTAFATGREFTGAVCGEILAPAGTLLISSRDIPYPAPPSATDGNLGGVEAEVDGSLRVNYILNAVQSAYIGGLYGSATAQATCPLTIVGTDPNGDLVEFRDSTGNPAWRICENQNGVLGLDFVEVSSGKDRLFIQPTQTSSSAPSPLNVGIGSTTPRNPLAIRAQGSWDELLSLEDPTGATVWHLNRNPTGSAPDGTSYTPGLNFCETQPNANFRLFLQEGGRVGIGTGVPQQNLSVYGGLNIDQKNVNGGSINPALTFGSNSGEGIASCRSSGGTNNLGIDFYTDNSPRMSITHDGLVGIAVQAPLTSLHIAGGSWDLNNTNGDLMIGSTAGGLHMGVALSGAGVGDARIRAQNGTSRLLLGSAGDDIMTLVSNRVGIGTLNPGYPLDVSGTVNINGNATVTQTLTVNGDLNLTHDLHVTGAIHAGAISATSVSTGSLTVTGQAKIDGMLLTALKMGYVADRFINRLGTQFEQGDVVVLCLNPVSPAPQSSANVPLLEVELTETAGDTRVCGIIDQPQLTDPDAIGVPAGSLGNATVGVMVTLGAYASCKVDADIAPIAAGDLLITSSTPGCAQNANSLPQVPPGAIIGKALAPLASGQGIISILVSHQ